MYQVCQIICLLSCHLSPWMNAFNAAFKYANWPMEKIVNGAAEPRFVPKTNIEFFLALCKKEMEKEKLLCAYR